MSGEIEVYLDETPGETRGIVARNGRYHHLIVQRPDDPPSHRLGARSVGRVTRIEPGLRGAFVDLGAETFGFLGLKRDHALTVGAAVEVETTAEPRLGKGPALRRLGEASGPPRLLASGPDVRAVLADLAPGIAPLTGAVAIRAAMEAEEEAGAESLRRPDIGLDVAVQRTRALIAVDIDHAPPPGRDGRKARIAANREGLREAARLIGLKGQGGLVVVDLVGGVQDDDAIRRQAKEAFGPDAVVGPLSRLGLLQLALPWTRTPIEDRLGADPVRAQALHAVRTLRARLLQDRAAPRLGLIVGPEAGTIAAALASDLGPRAVVRIAPELGSRAFRIEEI